LPPPRSSRAPRRKTDRNGALRDSDRQSELLAIAAEMFAARGFFSTTVRDIADEAGILSGSLYHHFDSKESMVDEILHTFLDGMLDRYREIVAEGRPPRETLEGLVRSSLNGMAENTAAIIIYQNEARYFSELPRFAYLRNTALEFRKIWIGVLAEGKRTGDFRPELDEELVYRLIRDTVWAAPRWFRPKGSMTAEKLASQYLDVMLEGIATPSSD
jgi:AcrR family transcriptional regulator